MFYKDLVKTGPPWRQSEVIQIKRFTIFLRSPGAREENMPSPRLLCYFN